MSIIINKMFKSSLVCNTLLYSGRFYTSGKSLSILKIYENQNAGEKIKIQGWVKSLRKMKENIFFDVSDGSCDKKLQVIIPQAAKPQGLTAGASIVASGSLNASPKGRLELNADNIEICGECVVSDGYPFAPRKLYASEYIRQHLHFRPRTNRFSSVLRVRDFTSLAIKNYLHEEGYIHIHTPILTSNDCEGAGVVFTVFPENKRTLKAMAKVDTSSEEAYFNSKVFLTVSGQLHLEAAAHSLSKVYTFGPTFRAENSKSRLHLSEFYMLEAECAFVDKIEQVIEIIEKLVKTITSRVLNKCGEDIERCREENTSLGWIDKNFVILTYDEAVSILNQNKGKYSSDFVEAKGFTKEHEHFLVQYCGEIPTFVINWPKKTKPFYMKDCTEDKSKVAALDLLVPVVGELVGGSLRENNYEALREKLPKGTNELDWYLDIRKFGSVPTGGFGLGFERYLQLILGISNIKDTIPFPRWPHNCKL